jgi:hypothetical protein
MGEAMVALVLADHWLRWRAQCGPGVIDLGEQTRPRNAQYYAGEEEAHGRRLGP